LAKPRTADKTTAEIARVFMKSPFPPGDASVFLMPADRTLLQGLRMRLSDRIGKTGRGPGAIALALGCFGTPVLFPSPKRDPESGMVAPKAPVRSSVGIGVCLRDGSASFRCPRNGRWRDRSAFGYQ
jgi:hypothetical protein